MFGRNVLLGVALFLFVVLVMLAAVIFNVVNLGALLGGVLVGLIASSVFAVFSYLIRKPRLAIEIMKDKPKGRENWTNFHFMVKNKGLNPAMRCHGRLIFRDGSLKKPFEINVRWESAPEPEMTGKPAYSFVPFSEKMDIFPSMEEKICYAVKYEGEHEIYGFGNKSYMYDKRKNPDWSLPKGVYTLDVELKYSGGEKRSSFIINNAGKSYKDVSVVKKDC